MDLISKFLNKRLKSLSLIWIVLLFCFLLVSQAMAGSPYDKLLFFPTKDFYEDPQSILEVKKSDLYIPYEKGKKLHCWYFEKRESELLVIVSHGNAGNISYRGPLIELLLQQGLSVCAYDYRGYGKSDGKPTINGVCEDGLAVFDYLVEKKNIDPEKIIVYGESLGGGISCYIASKRKCGFIILQSTFSSLPSVAKKVMPVFYVVPGILLPKNKMDNISVLEKKHPPLLIVHGTDDEVIPFSEALKLNKKVIEPKQFVPIKSAGHNNIYPTYSKELGSIISEFLKQYMSEN